MHVPYRLDISYPHAAAPEIPDSFPTSVRINFEINFGRQVGNLNTESVITTIITLISHSELILSHSFLDPQEMSTAIVLSSPEPLQSSRIRLKIRQPQEKELIPLPSSGRIIPSSLTAPQFEAQEQLLEDRFSVNTKRAYMEDWTHFRDYCRRTWPDVSFRLMSQQNLLQHVMDLAAAGSKYSTIGRRISGVLAMTRKEDRHMFRMELIEDHLQALRRRVGTRKIGQNPILKVDLYKMVDAIGVGFSARQVQDRALLLLTWHSAMRREESCTLEWSDLHFREEGLNITIVRSKTDQTAEGQEIAIIAREDGYCPIKHVLEWRKVCGGTGSLWRTILGQEKVLDRPLQSEQFYRRVKNYCMLIGLDPKLYSPHSLRSGIITQGAKNGVPVVVLQKQSRHRNPSGLDPYVRDIDKFKDNIGHRI